MIRNKRSTLAISLISILTFQSQAMDTARQNIFMHGSYYLEHYFSGTNLGLIPKDLYSAIRQYHEAKQNWITEFKVDGKNEGALDELNEILRKSNSTKAQLSLSLENPYFSGKHMLEAIAKENPGYFDQVVDLTIYEIGSHPYVFGKDSYFKNLASLNLRNIKKSRSEIYRIIVETPNLGNLTNLCLEGVVPEGNWYCDTDPNPHLTQNLFDSLPNLEIFTVYFSNGMASVRMRKKSQS